MTLEHIVLFRLHEGIDPQTAVAIIESSAPADVLVWTVRISQDTRKGAVIAERAVFESEVSFEAWRRSSAHRVAGEEMARISDWLIADFDGGTCSKVSG